MRTGTTVAFDERMIKFDDFDALVGLPAIREAEEKYYGHLDDAHNRGF